MTLRYLFNFDSAEEISRWSAIDDRVMGGVSHSRLQAYAPGVAAFVGRVSLDNNGGFASVRSTPQCVDLRGYHELRLRLSGDGQRYKLRVKCDAAHDGVVYEYLLGVVGVDWREYVAPFAAFQARLRGWSIPNAPPLDPARVHSFGMMISEGQQGPFQLLIDWIAAA
ncbi:MAG: hypothetical protein HJJLKODD_00061 [Phycisphaerae bacterium]|nr:hypothetical protein [Phycisphaerae bacterium]